MDYPRGVRPRGNTIQIRYQYEGKTYSETIKKRPNKTNIAYAARIVEDRTNDLKLGRHVEERENPDFFTAAQHYLNTARLAKSTRQSYKNCLNRYWLPELGKLPKRNIRYSDVWETDNNYDWPTGQTRKNAITALRQVFKFAKKKYALESNPAAELEQEKHQAPDPDPFTFQEKMAILDKLDGQANTYFTLAFETGARTGELLALTWNDYDGKQLNIDKAIVRQVQKDSTKTYVKRKVLLTPRAKEALNNCPTRFQKGYIFKQPTGEHYHDAKKLNDEWKTAIEAAKVRYRIAYKCRHTYASLGLTAGLKPGFLATQLGHTLETFFKTYARYMQSQSDSAELDKLLSFEKNWTKTGQEKRGITSKNL